jgi:plasmid stability protein
MVNLSARCQHSLQQARRTCFSSKREMADMVKIKIEMIALCCHFAGMATLTIRNLPDELHETLKLRAKRNRRSLNQEVIAELAAVSELGDETTRLDAARERMRRTTAEIDVVRSRMTRFMNAEEMDAAIEEGRR